MSAALWIAALAASLTFHAALAGVLALAIHPGPMEPQAPPESRLLLAAYDVRRSEAVAADPGGEPVPAGRGDPTALSQDAIPRLAALPQTPPSVAAEQHPAASPRLEPSTHPDAAALAATAPAAEALPAAETGALPLAATAADDGTRLSPADAGAAPAAAVVPFTMPTAAVQPPSEAAAAATPDTVTLAAADTPAVPTAGLPPMATVVAAGLAAGDSLPAAQPAAFAVPPRDAEPAATLPAAAPESPTLAAAAASAPELAAREPAAARSEALEAAAAPAAETAAAAMADDVAASRPASERVTAALAWSGDNQAAVDPVSLAAIQAFMAPSDLDRSRLDAGSVRDGIAGLLAQVPCARLQAEFIPETGALELRGHVPEEGLRAPVLAALQAQVGGSIPVRDNLLILPRPQCGALAGIAALGLPQSTDQATDARLVGENAHARLYSYAEGDRMVFDLMAPDYAAYVYVDYFAADGTVIHLVPNEHVVLERRAAKSGVTIGAGDDALAMFVGPPYGQEIAAAFAASAPLYDGLRPTVEAAAPYLEWLRQRVEAARAAEPGFKGEWVYFFVATAPAG